MPTQQEVFDSIVSSVEAGAKNAGKELEPEVLAALTKRYRGWIVAPGKNEKKEPVEKTPQEVWDGPEGELLRGKFKEIGRLAAEAAKTAGEGKVSAGRTDGAADKVETESDCPWCRTI
jgi:hypothetical protein